MWAIRDADSTLSIGQRLGPDSDRAQSHGLYPLDRAGAISALAATLVAATAALCFALVFGCNAWRRQSERAIRIDACVAKSATSLVRLFNTLDGAGTTMERARLAVQIGTLLSPVPIVGAAARGIATIARRVIMIAARIQRVAWAAAQALHLANRAGARCWSDSSLPLTATANPKRLPWALPGAGSRPGGGFDVWGERPITWDPKAYPKAGRFPVVVIGKSIWGRHEQAGVALIRSEEEHVNPFNHWSIEWEWPGFPYQLAGLGHAP